MSIMCARNWNNWSAQYYIRIEFSSRVLHYSCQSKPFNSLSCQSVNPNLHIVRTQCHIYFCFVRFFRQQQQQYAICMHAVDVNFESMHVHVKTTTMYCVIRGTEHRHHRYVTDVDTKDIYIWMRILFETYHFAQLATHKMFKERNNKSKRMQQNWNNYILKWSRRCIRRAKWTTRKEKLRCNINVSECIEP